MTNSNSIYTQLWGVNPAPVSITGSMDTPIAVISSQTTEVNSPIVTVLWLPKVD